MRALNRKLLRDLWRVRGQALAMAAVMGGGIATLVMALSAVDSLQETRRAYYEEYRFADLFATARRVPDWVAREIAAIPGVVRAEGRIVHDIIIDVPNVEEPVRGHVVSRVAGGHTHLNDVAIRRGRDLRPGHPDEVLVNEAFADAHGLELGDIVHGNINERRRALRIVGIALSPEFVYAIGPGEIIPDDRRFGVLWMSREALEAAYDLKGAFNSITLRLSRDAVPEAVIARVDRALARYGGTGAIGRADQMSDAFVNSEMEQLGHLATVIPPVFLVVAAFLFNVVLARIVQTEREQIGLLKAFGYGNAEVGWLYFKLVLAIAALGILLGWGAGAWLGGAVTRLYAEFFRFPFLRFVVDPGTFLIGAFVGIAAAGAGAYTAVRRAVSLVPAVAMVPPPPSNYRAGAVEQSGIVRILSPPARMILRHIFRWPLRATLAVTGISFSAAILIMSLFFFDSVRAMMEINFFETKHQDLSVTLIDERSGAVRSDLERLPGVMTVETFRTVSARLRHGHLEERVGVTGIEPDAALSPLVDDAGHVVTLPSEGIVLSDKLAQLLAAREGDLLTVSVFEGRRPVRQVPVMRIVRQYVGVAAYMDRRALNRLMLEGNVVSGAHLRTDSLALPALFAAFKETPALLGLSVRQAAFETFRDMMDQYLDTMVFIYVAFAAIIAVGVIYNTARILLSERARELASLRVLGYSRREVGAILAGELAVLTFCALPLGCFVGYGLSSLMISLLDTKLYRMPFVIEPATFGYAVLVVLAAAAASAWIVLRRVADLDLVSVLKTRE